MADTGAFGKRVTLMILGTVLKDPDKSNNRAEISALLSVRRREQRPLQVRPDSEVVERDLATIFASGQADELQGYYDFWGEIAAEVRQREKGSVMVKKVYTHLKLREALLLGMSEKDWHRSNLADALAIRGIAQH